MARYQFDVSFNVFPKLPQGQKKSSSAGGKRNRLEMEQPEGTQTLDQRSVRPRLDDPSQRTTPGDDNPRPVHQPWDSPKCGRNRSDSPASSLSLMPPTQLPWSECPSPKSLSDVIPLGQEMPTTRTDKEIAPILTEVNPESGSITGGATVWLKGMDFPTTFPLFARFGTTVVPTVRSCFCSSRSISSPSLDVPCFQPSCLSFAPRRRARCCGCNDIEAS